MKRFSLVVAWHNLLRICIGWLWWAASLAIGSEQAHAR